MAEAHEFTSYTYSEGRTGFGQLVEFTTRPEDVDKVKATLEIVRTITTPPTHKVNVNHGSFGQYSRYDVEHLKLTSQDATGEARRAYAGGRGGYIEALQINDALDGRVATVLHEYETAIGSHFAEFQTAEQTLAAFESTWSDHPPLPRPWDPTERFTHTKQERYATLPGFLRYVPCGDLTPWFYAIGNEDLIGDYVVPYDMQDDPVFKLGQKFLVEKDGLAAIKTCLGTRFREVRQSYTQNWDQRTDPTRIVYWEDGSIWKDGLLGARPPRLLRENELWVVEAMEQFKRVLSGNQTDFEIKFAQGGKFVGRFKPDDPKAETKQGKYDCKITLKDGSTKSGWLDFTPIPEFPTIEKFIAQKSGQPDNIAKIEAELKQTEKGGKKWSGVFYGRSND